MVYRSSVMALAGATMKMSLQQYLQMEEAEGQKHEFYDGEAWAMGGGTIRHSRLASRALAELASQLEGSPCEVYNSDLRVLVVETGFYAYPDLTVVCGGHESPPGDPRSVTNPRVVFEVLSQSTESFDLGAKADHYRHLESLSDLLLISQRQPEILHYRRTGDGWMLRTVVEGEVQLDSIGAKLSLDAIYEGYERFHGDPPRPRPLHPKG